MGSRGPGVIAATSTGPRRPSRAVGYREAFLVTKLHKPQYRVRVAARMVFVRRDPEDVRRAGRRKPTGEGDDEAYKRDGADAVRVKDPLARCDERPRELRARQYQYMPSHMATK